MYNFVIFTIFHIFWSENVIRFFFSFCQFSWFFQWDNFRMFWPTVQNCEDDVASFNLRAAHVVLRSKLFAWRKLLIISRTTNLEKNGALISRPNKVWHSFERAAQKRDFQRIWRSHEKDVFRNVMNHDNSKISQCLKTTKKKSHNISFHKKWIIRKFQEIPGFLSSCLWALKKKESSPKRRGHGEVRRKCERAACERNVCTRYTLLFQLQNLCRREAWKLRSSSSAGKFAATTTLFQLLRIASIWLDTGIFRF